MGILEQLKAQALASGQRAGGMANYLEPLATLGSAALAEPVAGWAGLMGGDVGGTRDAMTYQPRTSEGKSAMDAIRQSLQSMQNEPHVRGALDAYSGAADYMGGISPLAGALMQTAPTAAMMFAPGMRSGVGAIERAGKGIGNAYDREMRSRAADRMFDY